MKKNILFVAALSTALCAFTSVGYSATLTLWESDFDSTFDGASRGGSTSDVVAAPAGFTDASGDVMRITLNNATASRWGSVEPDQANGTSGQRNIILPASVQPGDAYTITIAQYTPPADNGFDAGLDPSTGPDLFGGVTLRWNNLGPGGTPGNTPETQFLGGALNTHDTSGVLIFNGTVPAGVTAVMPLLGVTNTNQNTLGAQNSLVYGYLDNINFTVEVIPEPTSAVLFGTSMLGLGFIRRRRR